MKLTETDNWTWRWLIVLKKITRIETEPELELKLQQLHEQQTTQVIAFVNAHAMNCVAKSEQFAQNLLSADLILRDGAGMEMLFRMLGESPGLNLNGTDLIPRIIQIFDGKRIALFGTQEPYLSNARQKILESIALNSLVTVQNGFKGYENYANVANEFSPDLIILGMGMPKQELIAEMLRSRLQKPCLLICGGAIIDFMGGKVQRAPYLMRKLRLEWLFRFLIEPQRLFYRYIVGNPLFIFRAIKLRWSKRIPD